MAHEVGHQKYQTVLTAVQAERSRMNVELTQNPGLTDQIMNPDGTWKPAFEKIYGEKYPLYTRFWKHDQNSDKRAKADGVTAYSKTYWEQAKPGTPNQVPDHLASHETIAEIAMLEVEKGEQRAMRDLKPVWRSYYRDVMKTYNELREAGKLPFSSAAGTITT
jgi:hypothetical protein